MSFNSSSKQTGRKYLQASLQIPGTSQSYTACLLGIYKPSVACTRTSKHLNHRFVNHRPSIPLQSSHLPSVSQRHVKGQECYGIVVSMQHASNRSAMHHVYTSLNRLSHLSSEKESMQFVSLHVYSSLVSRFGGKVGVLKQQPRP